MMERRTEESIAAFGRAVNLNPNSAAAHSHLSRGFAFAGRDREAIEHGQDAIRLSPLDPEMALAQSRCGLGTEGCLLAGGKQTWRRLAVTSK